MFSGEVSNPDAGDEKFHPDDGNEKFNLDASGEKTGEEIRETNERRGEKALSAEEENRLEELNREKEKLEKEIQELEGTIKEHEGEMGEQKDEGKESKEKPGKKPFVRLLIGAFIASSTLALAACGDGADGENSDSKSTPRYGSSEEAAPTGDESSGDEVESNSNSYGVTFYDDYTEVNGTSPQENQFSKEETKDKEAEKDWKELTGNEFLDKKIDGSFLQYDLVGCCDWNVDEKVSPNAVGNPDAVLKEMGIDPEKATPEQRGQVAEYFSYTMVPETAYKAIQFQIDGFDMPTLQREAEARIQAMSAEEKAELQNNGGLALQRVAEDKIYAMSDEQRSAVEDQLKERYDRTTYSEGYRNGTHRVFGIIRDGDERRGGFQESDLTGQKVLIATTTMENGDVIEAIMKEDCGNNADIWLVHHPDGSETVMIALNVMPESNPNPNPNPNSNPNPNPNPETHPFKNEDAERQNAGSVVTPLSLDEDATSLTDVWQDEVNFDKVGVQLDANAAAAAEAERVAAEQAAAESRAAVEAEQRRQAEEAARQEELAAMQESERLAREAAEAESQRLADEAAARAVEQAAAEQAAAAAAEQAAAAEAAARLQAQEEANIAAESNSAIAAENANASASERADMFANGDF